MPHRISSVEHIHTTCTISVNVKYLHLTNNIIRNQMSSRMKNLMFRNKVSKSLTFDTKRHFLNHINGFQRARLPFYNSSFRTYTSLEIVFATCKQDFCSVLHHFIFFFDCTCVIPVQTHVGLRSAAPYVIQASRFYCVYALHDCY